MKHKNKNTGASSTIIAAATLASLPLINAKEPMPTTGKGKDEQAAATHSKVVVDDKTIVGIANGETVYRGSKGELYTLDPMTGDKKVFKGTIKNSDANMKHKHDSSSGEIVGKDSSGRVIYKDAKGQKYTLDPKTGDKVLAK